MQEEFRVRWKTTFRAQCRATEKYDDQIFEQMKELEEKKADEALLLVHKKYDLWRSERER